MDLRYPGGQRAFHRKPKDQPYGINLEGYSVSNRWAKRRKAPNVVPPKFDEADEDFSASAVLDMAYSHVLPYSIQDRRRIAARIVNDPRLIEDKLSLILKALAANNPVIFYSGFSVARDAPIHLILIVGFAWLEDRTGRHLWLVVADPATQNNKVGAQKGTHLFFPPDPGSREGTDLEALAKKQVTGDHDLIRVRRGIGQMRRRP